jgi:hypothetical protein
MVSEQNLGLRRVLENLRMAKESMKIEHVLGENHLSTSKTSLKIHEFLARSKKMPLLNRPVFILSAGERKANEFRSMRARVQAPGAPK